MSKNPRRLRNLQNSGDCGRSDAFPVFSGDAIRRLRVYGEEEAVEAGTFLFHAGQRDNDMFVILQGGVDIIATDHEGLRILVARKQAKEFIGELDLITSRRTLADGVARVDSLLLRIPRERIRGLLDAEGEIANIIIRAAILRRAAMMRGNVRGVLLVGCPKDPQTLRVQEFLERNNYPYRFVHFDEQAKAATGLPAVSSQAGLPVVVLPGRKLLYQPKLSDLAEEIGLTDTIQTRDVYDVVIVGAGPAGLASAVYGASEGLSVVVLDGKAPGGQIGTSSRIENYLGFPTGLSGQELADRALMQAHKFGARIVISREVCGIRSDGPLHRLLLSDGTEVRTRAVIIASGATYSKLHVKDYQRFEYRGIHYAATGMEAKLCRNQRTAVVGGGNSAGQAALFLSAHADHVHLLVRGRSLQASMSQYLISRIERMANITIHTETEISELTGKSSLESVTWRNTRTGEHSTESLTTVFVMIGATPNSDWLGSCVTLDGRGFVLSGNSRSRFETSVPGIFAIGDIRGGSVKRVAAAAGEGAAVISDVHNFLATEGTNDPAAATNSSSARSSSLRSCNFPQGLIAAVA